MTITSASPAPAASPRPGSRAARFKVPRANAALLAMAADNGVCVRPMLMRRTNRDSGQTEVVEMPCKATLADKCPACARKAQRERMQQIVEGWHRTDEPITVEPPTEVHNELLTQRAHLEFDRAATVLAPMPFDDKMAALDAYDDDIDAIDGQIMHAGLRGRPDASRTNGAKGAKKAKKKRTTRRREDAPPLPRRKVQPHTVGRRYVTSDGKVFQPSNFLTLTLPSYGRVWNDGTPVDAATYDYKRAAWDAIHFPKLLDRFWQNLRRAEGWNVQYAGAVEPQRRLAPHAHFAVRGTVPHATLRGVAAATYHQVWWPPITEPIYTPDAPPIWDEETSSYIDRADPAAKVVLPTWKEAVASLDTDAEARPLHVLWFGAQVHSQGVQAGSKDADQCVRYIAKYLTKQAADCHRAETVRQQRHHDRLWAELRITPCSPRCANWLLYGIQPKGAKNGLRPGNCKGKAHKYGTLGMGGRRVLISHQWSGKTLADHRADNYTWVRTLLAITPATGSADETSPATDDEDQAVAANPYEWERAKSTDPDVMPLASRLLTAISARIRRRNEIREAVLIRSATTDTGEPSGMAVAA